MQPGYPGSGQDPDGQPQPPYSDPYAQPQYPPPQYSDPYAQPQPPYADPYAQPQPTSGNPYPTSGNPYPASPGYPAQPPQYPGQPPQYPAAPQYPVAGYGGGYGAPGGPGGPPQNNTLGLLSMIFGIAALPLAICCGLFSSPFSIAALVLGFLGLKRANEGGASNRGQAMAGLICGGVAIILMIATVALGAFWRPSSFMNLR